MPRPPRVIVTAPVSAINMLCQKRPTDLQPSSMASRPIFQSTSSSPCSWAGQIPVLTRPKRPRKRSAILKPPVSREAYRTRLWRSWPLAQLWQARTGWCLCRSSTTPPVSMAEPTNLRLASPRTPKPLLPKYHNHGCQIEIMYCTVLKSLLIYNLKSLFQPQVSVTV